MHKALNINEILDFAIKIEQNGYAFYTRVAKKFNNLKIMKLIHYLAEEELRHEHLFKALKKKKGIFKPHESYEGEYSIYSEEFLRSHFLSTRESVNKSIKMIQDDIDVVDFAIDFEKDSVVFFTTLKTFITDDKDNVIERIIQEEVNHLKKLFVLRNEIKKEKNI